MNELITKEEIKKMGMQMKELFEQGVVYCPTAEELKKLNHKWKQKKLRIQKQHYTTIRINNFTKRGSGLNRR